MIHDRVEFRRGERITGSQDCPTRAWRGRHGTISYSGWGGSQYVLWDGNQRSTYVSEEYLIKNFGHRPEW